jgi:hypothetical protein
MRVSKEHLFFLSKANGHGKQTMKFQLQMVNILSLFLCSQITCIISLIIIVSSSIRNTETC